MSVAQPTCEQATQVLCRVLCDDVETERRAQEAAEHSVTAFEQWVRSRLIDCGYAGELDAADYARLLRLMRP